LNNKSVTEASLVNRVSIDLRMWMCAVVGAAVFAVLPAPFAVAAGSECSNEAVRLEQDSTYLPDCRAYELVSPGSNPDLERSGDAELEAHAAISGDAIAYFSLYPPQNATRYGYYYLATRGPGGWSTEEVAPQDTPSASDQIPCEQGEYFSATLSASVLSDGWNYAGEPYCGSSEATLAADAPAGNGNLFLQEGGVAGPYQLIDAPPVTGPPANAWLEDATGDLSHVLFGESARLTPEAPAGYDLYEWSAGTVHLVSILPGGEVTSGDLADGADHDGDGNEGAYIGHEKALAPVTHAVSVDGESVFFYAEDKGVHGLYLREHAMQPQSAVVGGVCTEPANACTVQVDVSHGSGASGSGVFWDASEDSSRVFFSDESALTADSHAGIGKPELFEYDVQSKQLTDVTPAPAGEPANARGFSGASEDASYLYFVAKGALTGAQQNSQGDSAEPRQPNLYLYHEGALTFIATLNTETDHYDWQENAAGETNMGFLTAHASPNGLYISFSSVNEITGFENTPETSGGCNSTTNKSGACAEVFLYDDGANTLVCVSCGAAGVRPLGNTALPDPEKLTRKPGGPVYLSRDVFDDGRVFLSTPDALMGQDDNGVSDVYEYKEGVARLMTSGTSPVGSTFYDASPDGSDVFFVTAQSLVRADTDNGDSLYDARVGGGFPPGPGEGVEPEGCASEGACRAPAREAPANQFAASSTLSGPGNLLAPAPKSTEAAKKPTRVLTRAQKLANALRVCRKESKRKRRACDARARKRFGVRAGTKHAGKKHAGVMFGKGGRR
jgi:hypothetical protein